MNSLRSSSQCGAPTRLGNSANRVHATKRLYARWSGKDCAKGASIILTYTGSHFHEPPPRLPSPINREWLACDPVGRISTSIQGCIYISTVKREGAYNRRHLGGKCSPRFCFAFSPQSFDRWRRWEVKNVVIKFPKILPELAKHYGDDSSSTHSKGMQQRVKSNVDLIGSMDQVDFLMENVEVDKSFVID